MEKIKELLWALKQNKKTQMIALIGAIIIAVIILGFFFFSKNQDKSEATVTNLNGSTSNQAETLRRFTDGVFVASGEENPYPQAVMIENLISVRPQSGLGRAQIIYEALAEGGITRFLAVFANKADSIKKIGPVRSARPYFVDIAEEYAPLYVHAGGSPDALTQIQSIQHLTDLDQISGDHSYFWRTDDVAAPHNLFTSSELLELAARDKNVPAKGNFDPWKFKDDVTLEQRPQNGMQLTIDFSSSDYTVRYVYDRETNTYYRYQGEKQHIDALTNEQLHPKNIVIQKVTNPTTEAETGRLTVNMNGEGEARIYQDGIEIPGTWLKENQRTRFYNSDGKEIEFNAGQTWVEVVPDEKNTNYQ